MALGISISSTYVEGEKRTRRFACTGDSSYPTGGYDLRAAILGLAASGGNVLTRVISVRHRTLASSFLGDPIVVDTFSGGQISTVKLALRAPGGTAEVAAATNVTALNVEVIFQGYF